MSEEREVDLARAKVMLNSRNVWRWSIVSMDRRQSVAEHTYLVTVLGLLFYDQCMYQHSVLERSRLVMYMLEHDADEALLGDIPTPVKQAIEARYPGLLDVIRADMGAAGHNSHGFKNTAAGLLVTIADIAEALMFCRDNGAPMAVIDHLSNRLRVNIRVAATEWHTSIDYDKLSFLIEQLVAVGSLRLVPSA